MHIAAVAVAVIATGCYSPALEDCAYRCTEGACPSGLTCRGGLCRTGSNSGVCVSSDAATVDAKTSTYEAIIRRDHPIAYWRLGDMALSNIAREQIAQRDGAVTGVDFGVLGALFGDPDTAGIFQGEQFDCIQVPDDNVFDFVSGQTFSLEAWVKLDTIASSTDRLIVGARSAAYGYELSITTTGLPQIRTCDGGTCTEVEAPNALPPDLWFHLVATYNGPANHEGKVFVDGQQKTMNSLASAPPATTPTALTIGCRIGIEYFDGWLDEIAIYDYVLPVAVIAEHYDAGAP